MQGSPTWAACVHLHAKAIPLDQASRSRVAQRVLLCCHNMLQARRLRRQWPGLISLRWIWCFGLGHRGTLVSAVLLRFSGGGLHTNAGGGSDLETSLSLSVGRKGSASKDRGSRAPESGGTVTRKTLDLATATSSLYFPCLAAWPLGADLRPTGWPSWARAQCYSVCA